MTFVAEDMHDECGKVVTIVTYLWYESLASPYAELKSQTYTIIGRLPYSGTDLRTPTGICAVVEVDNGGTADIRVYDPINGTVAEKTVISNTDWACVDLGSLANLGTGTGYWEVQLRTSAANKNVRISTMAVHY